MLGTRIAQLRKTVGLKQAELAKRSGVSLPVIDLYEQGRRVPSCEALLALSKALGVTVQYLLSGNDSDSSMLSDLLLQAGIGRMNQKKRRHSSLSDQETAVLLAALLSMEDK